MSDPQARLAAALADRYLVERELGQGGMATVYLAQDIKHEREVAIKVLREDLSASLGAGRFLREIKIAAQLQHPHILPLLDSGEADGFLFFVMPYIKGQSLRERLAREGELPVHEAVRLLTEVVDALVEAHAHGVVHRDIKPDNVMLSGRHALVTDFGVAKAISEATGRNTVTTLGVAVGTPTYMSPEQAAADPHVDHRSDIYSVGVMAYEMLSGRPPFTGSTPQQVLAAHVTEAPDPVSKRRPAIPRAIEAVVMRCLAKRPADRFQTAAELHAALEPLATPSGGLTPIETRPLAAIRPRSPRLMFILAGAGVVACVALVVWLMNRPPGTASLTSNTQLTRAAGVEEFPSISPDGKSVAYLAVGPSDAAAHVEFRRIDGGDAVQIAGGTVPMGWSPSGDRLLVSGPRGLESRPALGGQGEIIDARAFTGSWSPDGKQVAYVVGDSLLVGSVRHEKPRLVTRALDPHSPAWSPDGKWIAFVSGNSAYLEFWNIAPSSVWIVDAAGGTPQQLTSSDAMNMSPTWAPDSRRLLIVSTLAGVRDVFQLNLTAGGRRRNAPVRISTGLNPSLISLSADGSQLSYSVATNHTGVWKIAVPNTGSVSTQGAVPVITEVQTIEGIAISSDGKWLTFDSNREGVQQVFRMPLAGGQVQRITRDSVPAFNPSFSPDGQEVTYHTVDRGLRRIFAYRIDGGRSPVQVSPGTTPDERAPSWSPDGRRIAWSLGGNATNAMVASRDSSGRWSAPATITLKGGTVWPIWGDLGTALVALDSSARVVLQPVDGRPTQHLPQSSRLDSSITLRQGVLGDDGHVLYITFNHVGQGRPRGGVYAIALPGGQMREVLRFDEPSRAQAFGAHGIAEFGGWLYFTLGDPESDIWVATVKGLKK
jgi:Tol biopolymer transport system component/tRNA A-37 threonylcarbamoyl transferase component Bud32